MESNGVILAGLDFKYLEKNKSRHGTIRHYVRIGKRRMRVMGVVGTEEFSINYWKARKAILEPVEQKDANNLIQGSFRSVCADYMRSNSFSMLSNTTQTKRRQIINSMWCEPINGDLFANMPFIYLDHKNIEVLRDRKSKTPFAADERLKVLRQVFKFAIKEGICKANIADTVEAFKIATDGHHTINEAELAQYFKKHPVTTKAGLCVAITMFTGLRVSDTRLLGDRNRQNNSFIIDVVKGSQKKKTRLTIQIHPILEYILSQHTKSFLYVCKSTGEPYTQKGYSQRISKWFTQAGLKHCTGHTIRKGLATHLAEQGQGDRVLDGMFGWSGGKTSSIYTRKAEQTKLATRAVESIKWGELLHLEGDMTPHTATPAKKDK